MTELEAHNPDVEFAEDDDLGDYSELNQNSFSQAVLWGTDWTVDTLLNQIERKNIDISPQFQRRDAWTRQAKSRFIESVVLGLPIPQIVLAERKEQRGTYLILDGKQRLLSLAQYAGIMKDSKNNAFSLSGLEILGDLKGVSLKRLRASPGLEPYATSFDSHTIRAIVIRNWPSLGFLHLVFQRLNTGSLKLSPQELRQAVTPGPFLDYVDQYASRSEYIHKMLGIKGADARMRDTELLVRFIAFQTRLDRYTGRMKEFIDESCIHFNRTWDQNGELVAGLCIAFDKAADCLFEVFGERQVARRAYSQLFNRSIFDALAFYAAKDDITAAMLERGAEMREVYERVVETQDFQKAVGSDTAGIPHTFDRLRIWGNALTEGGIKGVRVPTLQDEANKPARIEY